MIRFLSIAILLVCSSYTFAQDQSGPVSTATPSTSTVLQTATEAATALYNSVEYFRVQQTGYFENLRDERRARAGLPPLDTASGQSPTSSLELSGVTSYPLVIVFTALASFFAHKVLFYIASILFLLLFIRFLFRAFI